MKLFRYEAGDHVAVYPTNDPIAVDFIGKRLNIDLDEPFALENVDGKFSRVFCKDVPIEANRHIKNLNSMC